MDTSRARLPYGLQDIDQAIVTKYCQEDPSYVNEAGMVSCFKGADPENILPWIRGDCRKGTDFHLDPAIQLRRSPTYVYKNPVDNIIIDPEMVTPQQMKTKWGKAFPNRFENENSEDAVSWNVFRSLQQAKLLSDVAGRLSGVPCPVEPELYLWGTRIESNGVKLWEDLKGWRSALEPDLNGDNEQPTEPDIVLHVPGSFWLFIEAKFGSPHKGFSGRGKRDRWLSRKYPRSIIDHDKVLMGKLDHVPEQILRNISFAYHACEHGSKGEKAFVVALGREADLKRGNVQARVACYLGADCCVTFRSATWEEIYRILPTDNPHPAIVRLAQYLRNKTLKLRPALQIPR